MAFYKNSKRVELVNALLQFFAKYEPFIYLVLGIGAFFSLRSLLKAWSEWRLAVFGLEKELVAQRVRVSGVFLLLFLMIGLSQFCVVTFIVPFLPAAAFLATPTVDLTRQAATPLPENVTPNPGVTNTPAPPPGSIGCVPGQVILSLPEPGQEIQGKIVLTGTVNLPDFGFFKYEYAPQGSEQWSTIAAGDKIIVDGELGAWDTSGVTPGDYQLRLLVTNNLGEALPACIIPVRVVAVP